MMNYGFLLESVWHPPLFFSEEEKFRMPQELQLQALWYGGQMGRQFKTVDGRVVEIKHFGDWNRGSGPDFLRCCVVIDGEERVGAIELDIDSASWELHGHGSNPHFGETVLHVVFRQSRQQVFIRTHEHREVPQVVVPMSVLVEALNLPQREIAIAHPGRCVAPLKRLGGVGLGRLLELAAMHRAQMKVKKWQRMESVHGRDTALFLATAEGLGYHGNALAMTVLAQRVSLGVLRSEGDEGESILYGMAGFLSPMLHQQAPEETKEYLRGLWDCWWKSRHGYEGAGKYLIPWKTHGSRPANHPHRRVGALVALVRRWSEYRKLAFARPFEVKPVMDFLQSLEHPFWDYHYTLTSGASVRKIAILGKNQAQEIMVNSLIPLAISEQGMTVQAYYKLRSSVMNENVKRGGLRLFGSLEAAQPWSRRLMHQQALLQIYQDFCLEDLTECEKCPFPEQLMNWK